MRNLPLTSMLTEHGAVLQSRCGVQIPVSYADPKTEYTRIRNAVGVSDFSYMRVFRIPADSGVDFLDTLFAGNVAKIRFCRVLHTFMADEQGHLMADCYIANNDENFIVFCESILDDQAFTAAIDTQGAQQSGLCDITENSVVISIDGYKAWAVVKELFGADVLGLTYLSIETYPFEGQDISLIRAGKTSEFGYLLLAPKQIGPALLSRAKQVAEKYQGGLCGCAVHDALRLEGRFFNIFAEGMRVNDPLSLGLQWMIDFDKESFIGREVILQKREKGLQHKIIGIKAPADASEFSLGAPLFSQDAKIGEIQADCFSYALEARLGLALLPVDLAYAGLDFYLGSPGGVKVSSLSMPAIVPQSLHVKLENM